MIDSAIVSSIRKWAHGITNRPVRVEFSEGGGPGICRVYFAHELSPSDIGSIAFGFGPSFNMQALHPVGVLYGTALGTVANSGNSGIVKDNVFAVSCGQ